MKQPIILTLLLFLTIGSCIKRQNLAINEKNNFKIPIVNQKPTKDTTRFFKTDFLNESLFLFCGKYKFIDTIKFDKHIRRDTTFRKDFIHGYSRPRNNDTLTTDGFQIFVDYKTTIIKNEKYIDGNTYFPVYVVNETSRTKVFIGKDNYVFGIQEAIDTSRWGEWRPIESAAFDFCGNGYFGLKIHPGEFVMFLIPKYEGDEKQLMRIRLQNGEAIYLSQSYVGNFNRKQFNIKEDTFAYYWLKEYGPSVIQWLFYGATPKGYDNEKSGFR